MKKIILALTMLVASVFAHAEVKYSMPAIEGGFKWNSMDGTNTNSNKQTIGFQMGGSIVFDLSEAVSLKTGLMYSERPFKFDIGTSSDVTGKITYADIPVLAMFKVEDYAGIYVGVSLSTKIGDEVSGSTLTGVKSMITPITFGGQFKFTELLGLNLFFETVPGDLATGITGSRGIGANLMIAF